MTRSHQYTLYIDETGHRYPQHKVQPRDDGMDHFCWGGVLVNQDDEEEIVTAIKALRKRWDIDYPLHSSEIRGKRDKFGWLQDEEPRAAFMGDMNDLLTQIPVIGFGVVVSRPGYNKRYREKYGAGRWELCRSAHPILVERVVRYLLRLDPEARLRIIFEGSSGAENKLIVGYTRDMRRDGHPFKKESAEKYTPLTSRVYDRVIIGDAQSSTKGNFFLQIADLYIYAMSKRKYQPAYLPWVLLYEAQRVVDALLLPEKRATEGIKYYCFGVDVTDENQNSQT